jgi:hypothetical protein
MYIYEHPRPFDLLFYFKIIRLRKKKLIYDNIKLLTNCYNNLIILIILILFNTKDIVKK